MKNDPIVGYDFDEACYLPEEILPKMIPGLDEAEYPTVEQVEETLGLLASVRHINREDLVSFSSKVFPKPIYLSQLTCYDNYWTKQAPPHQFEGPHNVCQNCGSGR